jgi:hypothetical protein
LQKQRRHGAIRTTTHPEQNSSLGIHTAKIARKNDFSAAVVERFGELKYLSYLCGSKALGFQSRRGWNSLFFCCFKKGKTIKTTYILWHKSITSQLRVTRS